MLDEAVERGKTAEEARIDPAAWQRRVLAEDFRVFDALPNDEVVVTDTSFVEDLVFSERAGLVFDPNTHAWLRRKPFRRVFLLEPLEAYEQTATRMESQDVALQISAQVRARYEALGYALVSVPAGSVASRVAVIRKWLEAPS